MAQTARTVTLASETRAGKRWWPLRKLFISLFLVGCMPVFAQNTGYDPNYTGTGNGCVAGGTCYYIDYENGSDSNDGLAKTLGGGHGPWKTAPGMACATGKPASHSMNQTDEFILKGGVSWPRSCFEWVVSGGNAGTPNKYAYPGMYIGYDPTWNKGVVNSVRVIDPGNGCTSTPSVTITAAPGDSKGSGATATARRDTNVGLSRESLVSYVEVTNSGSNYTLNPLVSFGPGCNKAPTAVADIQSPVLDGSGGVFGTATTMPQLLDVSTTRLTFDHFEMKHMRFYAGADYVCGPSPNMIYAHGANQVLQNLYVHDFVMDGPASAQLTDCRNASTSAALYAPGWELVQTLNNSIFNNYESEAHGCFNNDGVTCVQMTGVYNIKRNTNNIYSNWRGGLYTVASASDFLVAGNKMWAILHDPNTQHEDAFYLMSGGLFYNNVLRDIFPGSAAFYIETGDGGSPVKGNVSYVFNNVAWNIGTSTPPIGWTSEYTPGGAGGASPAPQLFAYNNTFFATSGTMDCINAGQWFGASPALSLSVPYNFTLKNNFCISTQGASHWFNSNTSPNPCTNGCGMWNDLAQPNSGATRAAIDPLNVVLSPSGANSQGYTPSNNFAPTDASDATVAFADGGKSANLTNVCSGDLNGLSLAELCKDIRGNPRPASGGWEAGAYQFNSSDAGPEPPSGLAADVH